AILTRMSRTPRRPWAASRADSVRRSPFLAPSISMRASSSWTSRPLLLPWPRRKRCQLIRRLADGGRAVILISHNMHHVFEVADRIVVFRRGRKIGERLRSKTDPEEVVSFITGAHPDVRALETQG